MESKFFATKRIVFLKIVVAVVTLFFALLCLSACSETETESIRIYVQDDFKTKYFVGEELDASGSLKVYFDVDYYVVVPIDASMVAGFDSSRKGDCVVTVTFQGVTTSVLMRIVGKAAASIELDEVPTVLYRGYPFPSGHTFTAHMEDGTTSADIPLDVSLLSGFNPMEVGDQTITVSYMGATTSFDVTVKEDEIVSVGIENATEKNTEYFVGAGAPCLDGLKLRLTYDSGKTIAVDVTLKMVSGFDATKSRQGEMTVSYESFSCELPYRVTKEPISFLLDEDLPTVVEKGTAISGFGTIYYDDDTYKRIELSLEIAPDYSSDKAGNYEIVVTAENVSDVYRYTVLPDIVRHEISYTEVIKIDSSLNTKDNLHVFYETGEDEVIYFDDERLKIEIKDFNTAGTVEQKISFRTLEVTVPVLVCTDEEWNAVDHIEVSGQIGRELTEGDRLVDDDFASIEVSVVYKYLETKKVVLDPSWVEVQYPTKPLTENYVVLPVKVSCYGQEDTSLAVRMMSLAYISRVTGLRVNGLHDVYAVGDTLSFDELSFVAEYGGGYSYGDETPLEQAEVTGFSTSEPAEECVLSVTYGGFTREYSYCVISREEAEAITMVEIFGLEPILFVGDTIDAVSLDGVTMDVTYGNGYRTEQLVPTDVEGGPFTEAGQAALVVISGTCRAYYIVTIYPKEN